MEHIQHDFKKDIDGMFLFANETVLDFYPKFGFVPLKEYQAFKHIGNSGHQAKYEYRKLNLDSPNDLRLFERTVEAAIHNTSFPAKSKALTFFYCYANPEMGYKDAIYYIENLNCVAIVEMNEQALHIIEVFSPERIDLHHLIGAFNTGSFTEVILGFSTDQDNFECRERKDEDLQLFVSPELQDIFQKQKVMIPILSHT